MSFFISQAFAQGGTATSGPDIRMLGITVVAFVLIFYFIILRPQQKRSKEQKQLMNAISKGSEVLTCGGLVGRVIKIADTGYITIALNDATEVVIKRNFVTAVLPKGTMKTL